MHGSYMTLAAALSQHGSSLSLHQYLTTLTECPDSISHNIVDMVYTGTALNLTDNQMEQILGAIMDSDRTYWLVPFLMGVWLDATLFGILLVLFVRWQINAAKTDEWWVKTIVYFLMVLHLGALGYSAGYMEFIFGDGFGQYLHMLDINWARPSFAINALSRLPCSAFFTHRTWMMYRKNWAIPILIVPLFLTSAVCAFGVTHLFRWMPLPLLARKLALCATSLALATDISLTVLLSAALHRSKTGLRYTDKLITRIMRTLIETQLPPTIAAGLQLLVIAEFGDTSQVAYFHAAPRVPAVCLLILLNARVDRRRQRLRQASVYVHEVDDISDDSGPPRSSATRILVDRVVTTTVASFLLFPFELVLLVRSRADRKTQDDTIHAPSKRALPRVTGPAIGLAEENGHYTRDARAWA